MISIFDRIHESIEHFKFDGHKEFVCILSNDDNYKVMQEVASLNPANNVCTFEFAPSKEASISADFVSVSTGGITIHFKRGKFSYIGPVVLLK